MTPRYRFSPSPTGMFHVGGARSALFNWLLARQQGGQFILRIEDTDDARNEEEWVLGIQDALKWLGLDWDEYYRQSERRELYKAAADRLVESGAAFWSDTAPKPPEKQTDKSQQTPGFRDPNRDAGLGPGPGRALRFKVPEGRTTVHDVIRGEPVYDHATLEDFVIMRSDGSPLFLLANVVDDLDMRVTHVIRGEEHLPNTPKYILLWQALGGGELPVFAHLPVIVNEQRKKLSKRRDKVSLEQYIDEGYLFQAMRNYLALLGWAPSGNREIVTVEEMIAEFRLEDVNHSPAFFDEKKLRHFNAEYIRAMSPAEFVSAAGPFLERGPWPPGAFDFDVFDAMVPLVQSRIETLSQVNEMVDFLFLAEPIIDEASWDKAMKPPAAEILDGAIEAFESCEWTAPSLHDTVLAVGERHSLKLGKAQAPVRVAVTGRTVGPPLFESLELLGREATLARLRSARGRLG